MERLNQNSFVSNYSSVPQLRVAVKHKLIFKFESLLLLSTTKSKNFQKFNQQNQTLRSSISVISEYMPYIHSQIKGQLICFKSEFILKKYFLTTYFYWIYCLCCILLVFCKCITCNACQ